MWWFWPFHGFFLWWLFGRGITSIVVIVIIVWALTRGRHPLHPAVWAPPGPPLSSGLDILEQRYARGEINREEYLQKKSDLLNRGV